MLPLTISLSHIFSLFLPFPPFLYLSHAFSPFHLHMCTTSVLYLYESPSSLLLQFSTAIFPPFYILLLLICLSVF